MQARFVGLHLFALDFLFCPYNLPRKKVRTIRFSTAPSIDSSHSKATNRKSDTPYQAARSQKLVG